MILDQTLTFADSLDVSGAIGNAAIGDVYDIGAGQIAGDSDNMKLVIEVEEAFASAGAAVLEFQLASDAQDPLTPGSATIHVSTGGIPVASLTAGSRIVLPLPQGIPETERYLGVILRTLTAATTAGTIHAFITKDAQQWKAYPDAEN